MADTDGVYHRTTLPPGKMQPKVWERQKQITRETLPPQFVELVEETTKPLVQVITDVISPQNEFCGGKVVLIGDALAGFRPHIAASTSQAASDAMKLADMLEGKIGREQWREESMRFARVVQERGLQMGERSQFGRHPLSGHIRDRNTASKM
ncbi:hypothetical protein W97_01071 [Coniosporium apollinis CBS 100218]|uniref:2,6-dihydroxypyridine 3-monooxygenase substrate binding domain-containing protein n=1 Tax=Coniosporium apollinis (strain CBS 100218) TaxID=1168221 RepID=R7YIY8_CONA1|nr:uncharacterized protein W97_01071 [Coniosporium apollinis CBS 100218]EON61853.1 hypothetical protein W97_01071 [Coniosporium apollinis CBS 100218]